MAAQDPVSDDLQTAHCDAVGDVLVFPAASRPSIRSRISLDPKILFIILDIDAPIVSGLRYAVSMAVSGRV
jgi:tRNA threonylcarbamoyladenosine modification (KEOPS) complex  Pcc1 subunit